MDLDAKSIATLDNGEAPPTNLPAVFLSPLEAETLRRYQGWLEKEHLSAQLVCGTCGAVCQSFITTGDIGIFCDCRVTLSKVS